MVPIRSPTDGRLAHREAADWTRRTEVDAMRTCTLGGLVAILCLAGLAGSPSEAAPKAGTGKGLVGHDLS